MLFADSLLLDSNPTDNSTLTEFTTTTLSNSSQSFHVQPAKKEILKMAAIIEEQHKPALSEREKSLTGRPKVAQPSGEGEQLKKATLAPLQHCSFDLKDSLHTDKDGPSPTSSDAAEGKQTKDDLASRESSTDGKGKVKGKDAMAHHRRRSSHHHSKRSSHRGSEDPVCHSLFIS